MEKKDFVKLFSWPSEKHVFISDTAINLTGSEREKGRGMLGRH